MFTATTYTATLISTLMLCSMVLVIDGLPLYGRERGPSDLIAGEAFLSMLMGSRTHRSRYKEAAVETTTTTLEYTPTTLVTETELPSTQQPPSDNILINQVNNNLDSSKQSSESDSASRSDGGTVISVRVSSSVGTAAAAHNPPPHLVADASKSEFNVDEGEPITHNEPPYENKNYYPRDQNRARSVSYSTVVQTIPGLHKSWTSKKNATVIDAGAKPQPPAGSVAESMDYYVTSKYNPSDYNESLEKRSSSRYYEPTERNWGLPERSYAPKPYTPVVYGRPEQNYEVDEAVSVETNGRAHGIQPDNKNKKDDNQKVGYVVEGRNYRKYRVEERTSDGFIVGEYGVVSHDDGSLRGVRYTADGTISPRLIYDALMKFLSL